MIQIATRFFGALECPEDAIIHFPSGVPPFSDQQAFVIVSQGDSPFVFLQSVAAPELCFITVPVQSIDPAYRTDPSVGFMFNDKTLKALRKLKDGDGNYIWQAANVQTGAPNSLLGYRYNINQACADVGTSAKSILFGAMNRYIVRRVREFAVKRLVERYADYDQVGFIGFARYDGDLMDTAAVKYYIGHS